MRHAIAIAALTAAIPALASAGEVKIGMDAFGLLPKRCHLIHFVGPADALATYERTQKERFEAVDPAVAERLSKNVTVAVLPEWIQDRKWCVSDTDHPQKVVFAEKGSSEPLLVVPLELQEVERKNGLGAAVFSGWGGRGFVPLADLERLAGKELEVHTVFAERVQKDKWKKDNVGKILK